MTTFIHFRMALELKQEFTKKCRGVPIAKVLRLLMQAFVDGWIDLDRMIDELEVLDNEH